MVAPRTSRDRDPACSPTCFIIDGSHRFDDPEQPVPWQGFTTKADAHRRQRLVRRPRRDNQRVTVGERSVIGANSVVTADIPPFSIAAGAPARVLRTIEYPP